MIPNVLSIAGTDPTGGAGIHADLKTFSALGAYGMAVVTAVVAQNTRGVLAVHEVPVPMVTAQLDAVFDDVRVDAVKIGMLGSPELVVAVAQALSTRRPPFVVFDPVMVATSGDRLLPPSAVAALRDRLLPLVDVVTPNLPEAAHLLGDDEATDIAGMQRQATALAALGPGVLIKGGHLTGPDSTDIWLSSATATSVQLSAPRVRTTNTHGTGCTLSSAIAALRPQLGGVTDAIRAAKSYLTSALAAADRLDVGTGHGPVHHFAASW